MPITLGVHSGIRVHALLLRIITRNVAIDDF